MKKSYLFPNYFKKIGYCIAIPFIAKFNFELYRFKKSVKYEE